NQYYSKGAKHLDQNQLEVVVHTSSLSVENVSGGMNTTNLSMISALEDTEQLIQELDDIKFINTSSLGAKIKGADFMRIEDAYELVNCERHNFNYIADMAEKNKITVELETDELQNRISSIINDCEN